MTPDLIVATPAMTWPMVVAYVLPILATIVINAWLQKKSNERTEAQAKASADASAANNAGIKVVQTSIDDNTRKTEAVHSVVNGRTDALLARNKELELENQRLTAAAQSKGTV